MAENQDTAQERPLEPTERRLEKAREEGQFPQSRDLTTLLVLAMVVVFALVAGTGFSRQVLQVMESGLSIGSAKDWQSHLAAWASGPLMNMALWILALMIPVWLVSTIAPLALVKVRPVLAFKLDLSRLDPIAGLKRMFSMQTVTELGKNLLKIILVFGVGVAYVLAVPHMLTQLARQDLDGALSLTLEMVRNGFILLMAPIILIAVVDIFLQNFNFRKRMKMSHDELKQELKETEGSPELRAKIRQRQRQVATSRMMSALEKADVVLVNPEHYAVALRYDTENMLAPVVVAKGTDAIALKIQEVAREFEVPIARIAPLARLMHRKLEIGDAVPGPLFEAVAKVLAWAYEVKEHIRAATDLPEIGPLPDLEKKAA